MIDHVNIGGLDPASGGAIGYASPRGRLYTIKPDKLPAQPTPWDLGKRTNQIKNLLVRSMQMDPPLPTLMVIEGPVPAFRYQHERKDGTMTETINAKAGARLDEIRGVLRETLFAMGIEFVEIAPTSLKKFGTGKGQHPKGEGKGIMLHCATSRIHELDPTARPPKNHDEADAFHLRQMGMVALGLAESIAEYQLEAIEGANVFGPWRVFA